MYSAKGNNTILASHTRRLSCRRTNCNINTRAERTRHFHAVQRPVGRNSVALCNANVCEQVCQVEQLINTSFVRHAIRSTEQYHLRSLSLYQN